MTKIDLINKLNSSLLNVENDINKLKECIFIISELILITKMEKEIKESFEIIDNMKLNE